ncbi:MAG: hypothetical protein BAJATHORv1_140008 [Candidatus Thorarchaeota archaeon]|nr:MAG: hypothetical protein BAJATHORv1_140008 [Candidatus Thorarchaeota archaeon]
MADDPGLDPVDREAAPGVAPDRPGVRGHNAQLDDHQAEVPRPGDASLDQCPGDPEAAPGRLDVDTPHRATVARLGPLPARQARHPDQAPTGRGDVDHAPLLGHVLRYELDPRRDPPLLRQRGIGGEGLGMAGQGFQS